MPLSLRLPTEEVIAFHNRTYGSDFHYSEFGPMLKAELFNPVEWAKLFGTHGGLAYAKR
eukprot:SAG31_NODE_35781_length_320_cov_0.597285_2_plen_59_part_00